jgi:hypothetical protein
MGVGKDRTWRKQNFTCTQQVLTAGCPERSRTFFGSSSFGLQTAAQPLLSA